MPLKHCYWSFLLGAAGPNPDIYIELLEADDCAKGKLWVPGYQHILGRKQVGEGADGGRTSWCRMSIPQRLPAGSHWLVLGSR